jgi:predicted Zn-dependent protease with MMP-like domain
MEVDHAQFGRMLERAIALLPEQFRDALQTVRVEVRDRPTRKQLESLDMSEDELLLGLYDGTPLTDRSVDGGSTLPDVIYLFKEDLEDATDTVSEMEEEIRITLFHELGHFFGFDEDELDRLGYG